MFASGSLTPAAACILAAFPGLPAANVTTARARKAEAEGGNSGGEADSYGDSEPPTASSGLEGDLVTHIPYIWNGSPTRIEVLYFLLKKNILMAPSCHVRTSALQYQRVFRCGYGRAALIRAVQTQRRSNIERSLAWLRGQGDSVPARAEEKDEVEVEEMAAKVEMEVLSPQRQQQQRQQQQEQVGKERLQVEVEMKASPPQGQQQRQRQQEVLENQRQQEAVEKQRLQELAQRCHELAAGVLAALQNSLGQTAQVFR